MSWKAFFIFLCLLSSFAMGFPSLAEICNGDYDWRSIIAVIISIILFSLFAGLFFGLFDGVVQAC